MNFLRLLALTSLPLLGLPLSAADLVFDAFESDGYGEWEIEGTTFGKAPVATSPKFLNGAVKGYSNDYYVTSSHEGDNGTGALTSPEFQIKHNYITFLISGGEHKGKTCVQLLIDGKVAREATGKNDLTMRPVLWPVKDLAGRKAKIRILDDWSDGWGIINADHVVFTDNPQYKFPLTTRGGAPTGTDLVANKQIVGLLVPEDTHVRVFATDKTHQIHSPTAISVDEHNRVFLAETHRFRDGVEDNRDHTYWITDDIASQTTEDRRALHEKWKHRQPLDELKKKSERIRVLIDTNGDQKADETKIFADGFNDILDGTAAGIMALEGTVYFACIPGIYALEDEDGDLVSDTKTLLQGGFGVRVSFSGHDLNGFAQGPDGRIYATIGDRGFSFTTKEGRTYRYPGQGAILRFQPDGTDFQVVHTGLRNPKEIAFDQYGTAVTVDNNADQGDRARVVVMTEGADSGWRMGHQVLGSFHRAITAKEKPVTPWMSELMWSPPIKGFGTNVSTSGKEGGKKGHGASGKSEGGADSEYITAASHPAFFLPPLANVTSGPSGLAYDPGTGYRHLAKDRFLICDYRGGAAASGIWHFGIEPDGAGFKVTDVGKFNWGVAATDLEWGYDGRLYISDYIGGWVTHPRGRVYTLGYQGITKDPDVVSVRELAKSDFSKKSGDELSFLLKHPDKRIRLRAQLHLANDKNALAYFTGAANQVLNPLERLHGIWGLGILARRDNNLSAMDLLLSMMEKKNLGPLARGQVVKALGDCHLSSPLPLLEHLFDESPRVQALTALALSKHPHPDTVPILQGLLAEMSTSPLERDPTLWHALTLCLAANSSPGDLATYTSHESPAVRLAAVVALRRFASPFLDQFVLDNDQAVRFEAIRAIHDNYVEKARPAVAAILDSYLDGTRKMSELPRLMQRRLIYSAFRTGGEKNVERLVRAAAHVDVHPAERLDALRLLARWPQPPAVDFSTGKHAPLKNREVTRLKTALAKHIGLLFQTDRKVLGRSLALASQYKLAQDQLDSGTLTNLIKDSGLDAYARTEALKLLLKSNPEDPAEILAFAASSNQDLLASTALKLAAKRDPAQAAAAIKGALQSDKTTRRQAAWRITADLPAEFSVPLIRDGLNRIKAGKSDHPCMLEILDAARARKEPAIKKSLAEYEQTLASAKDPLAKWQAALAGGDARIGQKLFNAHPAAQCMRCHQVKDVRVKGGEAGPNLLGVALRHTEKGLLESLILPHAEIASGFGVAAANLKGGKTVGGTIMAQTDKTIDIKDGKTVYRIKKSDLKAPVQAFSSMPPMEGILTVAEARDLVAWLLTLTKESSHKPAPYEVTELKP